MNRNEISQLLKVIDEHRHKLEAFVRGKGLICWRGEITNINLDYFLSKPEDYQIKPKPPEPMVRWLVKHRRRAECFYDDEKAAMVDATDWCERFGEGAATIHELVERVK